MNQSMTTGSSPGYQSNSLSRSNTFNKVNASPKCFGTTQYVHKEEYERERQRFQQKLDEAEAKIVEATVNNSEMMQIKAELNKKIIEFEKNQRPLIEQNKRLSDRNRIIQNELKKIEERLCHSQDDYLTLKDAYDRLSKENMALKELRAFPEKLKELDRYRNQVLEYSKCINALRQAGLEKDRRYELLVQKFKRMKKCLIRKSDDDDKQSSFGSEGSAESSFNLDTITEDIDETLDMEHSSFGYENDITLKLSGFALGEEQILKEQLEVANATITELQAVLASQFSMSESQHELNLTISQQEKKIRDLQAECSTLKEQLLNTEENNDLLEFQVLELRELSNNGISVSTEHKSTETEEFVDEDLESVFDDIKAFVEMDNFKVAETKVYLQKIRRLACLKQNERDALKRGLQYIENLENKLSFVETELNMTSCELKRLESRKADEIANLQSQINELESNTSKKKKELQAELEFAKKELQKMKKALEEKEAVAANMKARIAELESALNHRKEESVFEEKKMKELQMKLEESEKKHIEQLTSLEEKLNVQLKTSNAITEELTKVKEEYTALIDEKENLHSQVNTLNKAAREKGEELESEVRQIQAQFEEMKANYEREIAGTKNSKAELEKELDSISAECTKVKKELMDTCKALQATQNEWASKVATATREAAAAVSLCNSEAEKREAKLLEMNADLEKSLQETKSELDATKSQVRPIGSQLERRYEEYRYRLEEANKKNDEYETLLNDANNRIAELKASQKDVQAYITEITQLKAYNQKLEDQFNEQMGVIEALKKKFISINNNSHELSVSWAKPSVQPTSSIDDEQYHSESSSIGSYNAVSNKA
ncbi:hypothetical protein FO519_000640 [Halicephalobus sp. NKZ332]|nr:hypothetical protein FO519_000640 [Halicephalobus sp. NKZ332]